MIEEMKELAAELVAMEAETDTVLDEPEPEPPKESQEYGKAFDTLLLRLNDLDVREAIGGPVTLDRNDLEDLNGMACELDQAHHNVRAELLEEIEALKEKIREMERDDVRAALIKMEKAAKERGEIAHELHDAARAADGLFREAESLLTPKGREKFRARMAGMGIAERYAKWREKDYYR